MYLDQGAGYEDISGLRCYLPKMPHKHLIAGYELKKKDQYWRRTPLPDFYHERRAEEMDKQDRERLLVADGKLKEITHVDPILEKFRIQEWTRRYTGFWFYNNGTPTYVTGPHYFFLNWCQFDHTKNDGYPFYYDASRKRWYFRQYCKEDPCSLGYIIIGPRAFGKSSEEGAAILEDITKPPHRKNAAIQATTGEAAKEILKQKIADVFKTWPDFFKPVYNHGSNPENKMSFFMDSKKGRAARKVIYGRDFELSNTVFWATAEEKALDKSTLSNILQDELGKTEEADVYKRLMINRFCVYRNNEKIGLIRGTTTIEEMEHGGEECLKIWDESNQNFKTPNGFTLTGLYRMFVSILEVDNKYADIYGFVDKEKSRVFQLNERHAREHDPIALNAYIRKNPITEDEAFLTDAGKCVFNAHVIDTRVQQLNAMPRQPYIRGNFYWVDGIRDGKVAFERDDISGKFQVTMLLDGIGEEFDWCRKLANNVDYELDADGNKEWYPKNDNYFGIGADTIKWTTTDDPRASKAAAHGFLKYQDILDKDKPKEEWISYNFIFQYHARPDDPKDFPEDMIMAMRYYGCSINPESNLTDFAGYIETRGYRRFLTRTKHFDATVITGKKDETVLTSHPEIVNSYINKIQSFINTHGMRFPFRDTYNQCKHFLPKERTRFDLVVSMGFTLLQLERKYEDEIPEDEPSAWMDEYQINGNLSELVDDEYEEEYEMEDDFSW